SPQLLAFPPFPFPPALRTVNAIPPVTARGVAVPNVSPVPRLPVRFGPQQNAAPPVARPQLWTSADVICVNTCPPATAIGVGTKVKPGDPSPPYEPSPSRPTSFNPQQYPVPPTVSPHVWKPTPPERNNHPGPPAPGGSAN